MKFIMKPCLIGPLLLSVVFSLGQGTATFEDAESSDLDLSAASPFLVNERQGRQMGLVNNAQASDIRFILYTSSTDSGLIVSSANIDSSNFDDSRDTNILIHSWMPNGENADWWITDFQQSLFSANSNINLIVVNWVDGNDINYFQSAANAEFVAQTTASFLSAVQSSSKGLTASRIHFFGHGIGAHIAGIVHESFTGVGKITAFDPCGRSFDDRSTNLRLDAGDADFVDVIHTDVGGMGSRLQLGDVDIYYQGGSGQPGATAQSPLLDALLFVGGEGAISGSHFRGIELYEEAIQRSGTTFNIYAASSYEVFLEGNSFGGTPERFGPSIATTATGTCYASSLSSSPYLSNNYYSILVTTTTSRLGADLSLVIDGLPNGVRRTVVLESEGGLATAASAGNYRSVITLPDGATAADFTYSISYTVDDDAVLIAASAQSISGVTLRQGDTTTFYGNCDGLTVQSGSSAAVTLAQGTNCAANSGGGNGGGGGGDGNNLDTVTTTLIVLAATSAAAVGAKAIVKLKKLVKKIKGFFGIPGGKPKNPLLLFKVLGILKGGITSVKGVKLLQIKTVLAVGKLMKGLTKGPLLAGLLLILKGKTSFGLKIRKMTEFVSGITGMNSNNASIKTRILNLLLTGNTDSLLEQIVDGLTSAIGLGTL